MTYRDVLVLSDGDPASAPRLQTALGLAARFGARAAGLFPRYGFPVDAFTANPFAMPPPFLSQLLSEHETAMDARQEAARMAFETAAAQAGVRSRWIETGSDPAEALAACMLCSDLTVLPAEPLPVVSEMGVEPARLALSAGGPVLVIPAARPAGDLGRRVLVAWNGKREAGRALRDAWPILVQAEAVQVVIVDPEGDDGPAGLLQRYFEAHGRPVEVIVDRSQDAAAAEVLSDQVKALGADLLVMGLYGRSRLSEFLLGGVSRSLLAEPPCALFLSH